MRIRAAAIGTAFAVGVTMLAASPIADAASVTGPATPQATDLTFAVSQRRLGPGDQVTLSAQLVVDADASPLSGQTVRLQWQRLGRTGWRTGDEKTTGQAGRAVWTEPAVESRRYRVVFDGTVDYAASESRKRTVYVKPVVKVSVSRHWVRPDASVKVKAQVRPAFGGEKVSLERRTDGQWTTVKRKRQGGQGVVAFRIGGMSQYGPQKYRVVLGSRAFHLGAKSKVFEVRTVRLVTYVIETRGKVKGAMPSFRQRTAEIYADPRGWSRANVHFKRVKSGGAFSLVLSQAKYVPTFAPICDRYWSCRVGRYVIINEDRWRHGTPYFKSAGGNLRQYRAMVVNHETGHWFGLGHASCPGSGKKAPVMMQQSKGLYGCEPNPWPLSGEIARA